jgi:hypothetical protein
VIGQHLGEQTGLPSGGTQHELERPSHDQTPVHKKLTTSTVATGADKTGKHTYVRPTTTRRGSIPLSPDDDSPLERF